MARVFTGKVVIPGDKIEEYFKALAEAEKARKPFKRYLENLNEQFEQYLTTKYSQKTARKHSGIIGLFIIFLCEYSDVQSLEEVTKGIVNTHFRQWYKRKVLDSTDPNDLRIALKKFFQFLDTGKGIKNPKVLEALE